jgi:5-methyltetrahydropteroyltriglutamate--homocysteine methyltransferase
MRKSTDYILTSQAGSLPRPPELVELNAKLMAGEPYDEEKHSALVTAAVADVVKRQVEIGITVPGDGELGKATRAAVDYGAWSSYVHRRLGGFEVTGAPPEAPRPEPGKKVNLRTMTERRDRQIFAEAYADPESGITTGRVAFLRPECTGPVTYIGQAYLQADIANFRAALDAAGVEEGFMTAVAPGSASRVNNKYYKTEEEFIYACADAMREEYKAIVDAGFVLQLDDPAIAENWDQINPAPSIEDYQEFSMVRVEALNHALRGLPEDRIRFHLCWGSWHGPHTTDLPMKDIVNVMLAVNAQAYSFEAGNVRHEHEWKVWEDVKLPDGKIVIPGVVSHATNVIEHPELVADRILRFANLVGRENVIAATDCGLGGRIHPQIAWAKLEALAAGAALASKQLWL